MKSSIAVRSLANGLSVALESIPGLASASFAILAPVGSAADPDGKCGLTSLLSEMVMRGAGDRDARALTEGLDGLGIERSVDFSSEILLLSGSCLSRKLPDALAIFRDILLAPRFDDDELQPSIELALQSILAIEDTPSEKLFVELGRRYLPDPHGRPSKGVAAEVSSATTADLRTLAAFRSPCGMILSIAGDVEHEPAFTLAERLFGGMPSAPDYPGIAEKPPEAAPRHVVKEDAHQVQIGMAMSGCAMAHPDYVKMLLAVTVLSGGMSGRLFVEVREKRGLVYAVRAFANTMRSRGDVYVYAGTTPERAEETERVVRGELERLSAGVTDEELSRARTQLRSSVVMSQESSRGRATTMATDLFRLGRVRDPDAIIASIAAVGLDDLNAFLSGYHPAPLVVTLGPSAKGEKAA